MFQALLDELPALQSLDCRNLPSGNGDLVVEDTGTVTGIRVLSN